MIQRKSSVTGLTCTKEGVGISSCVFIELTLLFIASVQLIVSGLSDYKVSIVDNY